MCELFLILAKEDDKLANDLFDFDCEGVKKHNYCKVAANANIGKPILGEEVCPESCG